MNSASAAGIAASANQIAAIGSSAATMLMGGRLGIRAARLPLNLLGLVTGGGSSRKRGVPLCCEYPLAWLLTSIGAQPLAGHPASS